MGKKILEDGKRIEVFLPYETIGQIEEYRATLRPIPSVSTAVWNLVEKGLKADQEEPK